MLWCTASLLIFMGFNYLYDRLLQYICRLDCVVSCRIQNWAEKFFFLEMKLKYYLEPESLLQSWWLYFFVTIYNTFLCFFIGKPPDSSLRLLFFNSTFMNCVAKIRRGYCVRTLLHQQSLFEIYFFNMSNSLSLKVSSFYLHLYH